MTASLRGEPWEGMQNFMLSIAEAMKLVHTDKDLTVRVLGEKLRIDDRNILERPIASISG
jgi:hypothetical protein